jgi:hypothetical protein
MLCHNQLGLGRVPDVDTREAKRLIEDQLAKYRALGYAALLRLLEEQDTFDVEGSGGTTSSTLTD